MCHLMAIDLGEAMNGLMGMGLIGWLLALAAGFVLGGVYFLSIKLQVEYVVKKRGPLWLLPAALYARLVLVAVVLIVVAVTLPGSKIPAAMLSGVIGAFLARILVSRMVRKEDRDREEGNADG